MSYKLLQINQLSGEIPPSICNVADSHPSVRVNRLCPQYFGTENESYPSCISSYELGYQDTSDCVDYVAPGDLNGDGLYNILDVVLLVNCILNDNGANCPSGGDMNGDDGFNILDVVTLVNCILPATCEG